MCGKTGGSVVIRARTPTQSESALNTVSPGDTVVGESSGTVSTPDTGPLDAVMYGVPVNKAPWVFAKKTSKSTLPPPVTLKIVAAPVMETLSTVDFPKPPGSGKNLETVESTGPTPPGRSYGIVPAPERKLRTSTLKTRCPWPHPVTALVRERVRVRPEAHVQAEGAQAYAPAPAEFDPLALDARHSTA